MERAPDHRRIVDRAGQVEEYEVERGLLRDAVGIVYGPFRAALHDRIGFLAEARELFVGQRLVMVVFQGQLQVALPHPCDGVLRVIAVHDRHVVTLHVVQV